MSHQEQDENTNRMVNAADLLRRGATLLREPCPKCGAVQIRYKGKIYCTNEDDLSSLLSEGAGPSVGEASRPSVSAAVPQPAQSSATQRLQVTGQPQGTMGLQKILEEKLTSVSKQLDSTTDVEEQQRLLDLISKYVETLDKLKKANL